MRKSEAQVWRDAFLKLPTVKHATLQEYRFTSAVAHPCVVVIAESGKTLYLYDTSANLAAYALLRK